LVYDQHYIISLIMTLGYMSHEHRSGKIHHSCKIMF